GTRVNASRGHSTSRSPNSARDSRRRGAQETAAMRRLRFLRFATFIPAALLISGTAAAAADFEHRLLVRGEAAPLAGELNRAGASGFRLSALIDRADEFAALVARPL